MAQAKLAVRLGRPASPARHREDPPSPGPLTSQGLFVSSLAQCLVLA